MRLILVLLLISSFGCASDGPGGENVTRSECLQICNASGLGLAACTLAFPGETADVAEKRRRCEAGVRVAVEACRLGCEFADPDEVTAGP